MYDPFKIDEPTCISFSFGRSSALMRWRVLDANGGLPSDARVLACNTGKEDEASLKFGERLSREWCVPITLLEYREGGSFEVVTFRTASRNGEPFDAVIRQRGGWLPNPVSRYCSSELKTRTMHRYLRQVLGWIDWETLLGIRADETRHGGPGRRRWRQQPFGLELPNIGGGTAHGNCTRCFLKTLGTIVSLEKEAHDP